MGQQPPFIMTLLENLVETFGKYNYATGSNQFLSLHGVVAQFVQVLQGNVLRDIEVQIGMSSNLDTLCIWMLFIRSLLARSKVECENHFPYFDPRLPPT
jgi:hypothetical protein